MTLLQYAQRLYSLDTLDIRFTSSAKTPPAPSYAQIDPAKPSPPEEADVKARDNGNNVPTQARGSSPSLWGTPEFYFYYLIFIICVPLMFKSVYDVSKRECSFEPLSRALPGTSLTATFQLHIRTIPSTKSSSSQDGS